MQYIIAIEQKGEAYRFTMYEKAKVKADKIPELLQQFKGSLTFKVDTNPYFVYEKKGRNKKEKDENILECVKSVITAIQGLIE